MKQNFGFLSAVLFAVVTMFCSCCSEDVGLPDLGGNYSPSSYSQLLGVYAYYNTTSEDAAQLLSAEFCQDNQLEFYEERDEGSTMTSTTITGKYSYDPSSGYGIYNIGDSLQGNFFAENSGFIVLYDEDDTHGNLVEGVWLPKCSYDISSVKAQTIPYEWPYADDFGCKTADTEALDVDDIGYQPGATLQSKSLFVWTVSNVAMWAVGKLGNAVFNSSISTAFNSILSAMGVGMGNQLGQINTKLNTIMANLDRILPALNKLMDGQAEAQFNSHKKEVNELNSIVSEYFSTVMELTDSTARMDYLKKFDAKQGTNKTAAFLDNISAITIQNADLYNAYDKYLYQCYPWEDMGYVARESFRARDFVSAFEGTILSVLYYHNIGNTDMMKQHLTKLDNYMTYYNKFAVKRDSLYAVCQIPNCKIRIKKIVDKRDFQNQTWMPKGIELTESYLPTSNSHHGNWMPGEFAYNMCYGNNQKIPVQKYCQSGLKESEATTLINFYGGKKTLQDILFKEASCTIPYTSTELSGKTLCIMCGNTKCNKNRDEIGAFANQKVISFSAYTTDNKYTLHKAGTPKVSVKEGKRLWYTLGLVKEKIHLFEGWDSYNSENLWCYPTVIR